MSALRESRGSDVFRFECTECGGTYRVRAHDSVGAILTAARRGWSFPKAHRDLCPSCKPASKPKARTAPKR